MLRLPSLLLLALLLVGCGSGARGQVVEDVQEPVPLAPLEIPLFFDPAADFIMLSDFAQGWKRFTTKDGKLSFLYPPSWQVDDGEWNITRTIFVGTSEGASHPVDLLLTVHPVRDIGMEEAVQNQYEQIRINPLTGRIVSTVTPFLDPSAASGSGRTIVAYRTTLDADRSFLHLIVPRRSSLLTIETPTVGLYTAYPLRVLLESVTFRD
jgi:hypothetical protein